MVLNKTKPFVSVIVPVKNEAKYISACIVSIFSQDYPSELFEVIVVDNGSTDDSVEIARSFGVHVVSCPDAKIGAVRNRGACEAKGDILAYIDGDCTATPSWISSAVELLSEKGIGAAGGAAIAPADGTWIERVWALNRESSLKPTSILATGSFFVKRTVFNEVRGFNEDIVAGEDTEICRRICANYLLFTCPGCDVIHYGYPQTVSDFLRRQIWQTSDYLHTKKEGVDYVFYFTHFFLFGILALIYSIFCLNVVGLIVSIFSLVVMAGVLGSYRLLRSIGAVFELKILMQVFLLNFLYLVARSVGLTKSYIKIILRKE